MRERILPQIEAMKGPWFQNFLTYDIGQDWAKITVPVLALFGGLDVQVDADQNSPALKSSSGKGQELRRHGEGLPESQSSLPRSGDRERGGVCHLAHRLRTGLSGHDRRLVDRVRETTRRYTRTELTVTTRLARILLKHLTMLISEASRRAVYS